MSVKRLCVDCGGERAPDCTHDPFERPPLTLDDILKESPFEQRLAAVLGLGHQRLLDNQRAEERGQRRLW